MKFLRGLDLSKRFILLVAGIILLSVFSAQWFYARQSQTFLELRLKEKASFINKFYSYVIAGLLMRKDDIGLLQVINTLEEDHEISSVIVVDTRNRIRYHIDPQKVGMALDDPWVKNVLKTGQSIEEPFRNSGGRALGLVSPLKVPGAGQMLGVMRIDLTHHYIESQMAATRNRFWFISLGAVMTCAGLMLTFLTRWILVPLQKIRGVLSSVNLAQPESQLEEGPDELGQTNSAVNALMLRFKNELQHQSSDKNLRGQQEKTWVQQLAGSLLPDARLIIADKDNRVIADTGNGAPSNPKRQHLLDLIKEANFANLLTAAFQKEGQMMKGAVSFQDQSYQAFILSVPSQQSIIVKTLIALQPNR